MNMSKPMNYVKSANVIIKAVQSVAEETIADAVMEIRNNAGVVTVISMDTSKILDCEPMGRYCKACHLKESQKQSDHNR